MRETICTIPINDVFGPREGCPICRLRDMLEHNYVEYITGAAMMEPDVRVETNQKGFCRAHFEMMVQSGKRLQNALLLQTHLEKIAREFLPASPKGKPDKKQLAALSELQNTCFVCDKIDWGMSHMFETVFHSFENDEAFRTLFEQQEYLCLPHYTALLQGAMGKNGVSSKKLPDFYKALAALAGGYLKTLGDDVSHFCSMYDYRSRGGDWKNSKDAIERAVAFLTGRKMQSGES